MWGYRLLTGVYEGAVGFLVSGGGGGSGCRKEGLKYGVLLK